MTQPIINPTEIEKESFRIITAELGDIKLDSQNANIIKRVIHTSADFDYAENLVFSTGVVDKALAALTAGARIVTDTKMGMSGINRTALEKTGSTVHCFIDAPEVADAAQKNGSTRALAAVDYAVQTLQAPVIFVVGNAPTALIRLHQLIVEDEYTPALIIGVPVGFVNVVESKDMILELDVPHIIARGRKGGSNVAAAVVNALLYEATGRVL